MPFKGTRAQYNAYQRKWQKARAASGTCIRCGKPRGKSPYSQWCKKCGDAHRKENRLHSLHVQAFRRLMALCIYCGRDNLKLSRSRLVCPECLDRRNKAPSARARLKR